MGNRSARETGGSPNSAVAPVRSVARDVVNGQGKRLDVRGHSAFGVAHLIGQKARTRHVVLPDMCGTVILSPIVLGRWYVPRA